MRHLAAACLLTLLVAGCGGDDGGEPARVAAPPRPPAEAPAPADGVPREVPREATGPAPATAARVVRGWLRDLSRGDLQAATRRWALPAKFQNGTPVLTIDSALERLAIHEALPCGGTADELGGAGPGYVVVTIRLRERPGASCGGGAGGTVRSTFEVRGGKIRGLYRLPEGDRPQTDGPTLTV